MVPLSAITPFVLLLTEPPNLIVNVVQWCDPVNPFDGQLPMVPASPLTPTDAALV
jgi:hypothetical protein